MLKDLNIYSADFLASLISLRTNETKLGENIQQLVIQPEEDLVTALQRSSAHFVLLGLPEDIGVRANLGRPGTASCWEYALNSFLNTQSNTFIHAESILVLGHVVFDDLTAKADQIKEISALRKYVSEIDNRVESIVYSIVKAGKIPICIGGGHNNSYPLLKGSAKALYDLGKSTAPAINCINCDAHTDLRPLEGRHSGNGFSYALQEGFLNKYYMLGLHEAHITGTMQQLFTEKQNRLAFSTFEDIAVRRKLSFEDALQRAIAHTKGYCGIELDMDCIQNLPSSAQAATGLQPNEARQFLHVAASHTQAAYLHITEAAPALARAPDANATAKLISALVLDFIKSFR